MDFVLNHLGLIVGLAAGLSFSSPKLFRAFVVMGLGMLVVKAWGLA